MNPENLNAEDIGVEVVAEMDREFHESTDRVIAIVGAAYLDSMLDKLLRAVFIQEAADVDRILRPEGPLGSNGARYQLCYCLDLITREQRDDLKIIAKIRNTFAHDFKAASFGVAPLRDYCASLKQPGSLAAMPAQLFSGPPAETMREYVQDITATPRERYRISVISLFGSLLRRVTYVRRVTRAGWYSYDPDALAGPPPEGPG